MKRKLKVSTLQKEVNNQRRNGKSIGFVPTMGALHEGHISLIEAAKKKSDIVVCSIFVNPSQFNDKNDLRKYPRPIKSDLDMLRNAGCHIAFTPWSSEVYPDELDTHVELDLEGLDEVMEGEFRPGHFEGVIQVVKRLLDIVLPDHLYMGQKDFQQFTIIQHMIDRLDLPTELVVCPIMREPHGLAMSSRNRRLDPKLREKASIIFQTLEEVKSMIDSSTPSNVERFAMNKMEIPGFKPEYFALIDGNTLRPIHSFKAHSYVVACTAVWAGKIRLIDNMIFRKSGK